MKNLAANHANDAQKIFSGAGLNNVFYSRTFACFAAKKVCRL